MRKFIAAILIVIVAVTPGCSNNHDDWSDGRNIRREIHSNWFQYWMSYNVFKLISSQLHHPILHRNIVVIEGKNFNSPHTSIGFVKSTTKISPRASFRSSSFRSGRR